jgi:hypothetical protein
MRLGKLVPIYKNIVPIPRTLSTAFGLLESSELNIALIKQEYKSDHTGAEIVISPVPVSSWKSVAHLSVRLKNSPRALAKATEFLSQHSLDILLTEACVTFGNRAHWDAICDVSRHPEYISTCGYPPPQYEKQMSEFLSKMTESLESFASHPDHRHAFVSPDRRFVRFKPLAGLNDSGFSCDTTNSQPVSFSKGGIEVPSKLIRAISRECRTSYLPDWAIVTGNTEQRYLRVSFLTPTQIEEAFRACITFEVPSVSFGSIGAVNQFLVQLPTTLNIIKFTSYITKKSKTHEQSIIEMIGLWSRGSDTSVTMETELGMIVNESEYTDPEGNRQLGSYKLKSFKSLDRIYPKVFISYSLEHKNDARLEMLDKQLRDHDFIPVYGDDLGYHSVDASDIKEASFGAIRKCFAAISLHFRRNDYKIDYNEQTRYLTPPWIVAEEVFAWSKRLEPIIRIVEQGVEDPKVYRDLPCHTYISGDLVDFEKQISRAISQLQTYKGSNSFRVRYPEIRRSEFRPDLHDDEPYQ